MVIGTKDVIGCGAFTELNENSKKKKKKKPKTIRFEKFIENDGEKRKQKRTTEILLKATGFFSNSNENQFEKY